MKKVTSLALAVVLMFTTAACTSGTSQQLMIQSHTAPTVDDAAVTATAPRITDLSAKLFANTATDQNTLISPISIIYALGMTANGAENETLTAFENFFGADTHSLNQYLYSWRNNLYAGEKARLTMANAIWFRQDSFTADSDFLATNATWYDAGIYSAPFDDSTVNDINRFVKKNTDGQIDKIIDKIEPQNVMFLVNALSFDGKWATEYERDQIRDGSFTTYNGTQQDVSMLYGQENTHLQDENTTGFVKDYYGGNYRFVALLPDQDVDIVDYAKSLTGEKITNLLENPSGRTVLTKMPEFTTDYSVELKDTLSQMGLAAAFDNYNADLSGLGSSGNNLYISSVLHKTTITVDRGGTKAAAVTLVAADESAAEVIDQPAQVYLDRPFVYMITDAANTPIFIGMVLEVE